MCFWDTALGFEKTKPYCFNVLPIFVRIPLMSSSSFASMLRAVAVAIPTRLPLLNKKQTHALPCVSTQRTAWRIISALVANSSFSLMWSLCTDTVFELMLS